ncbi:Peroxisomal N(1)-acetyl-spermine/spermidine oxidase [Seminavis robusta]|uniref:Peroxisomal N(1)-acetyl-spermine/spermidine oxidase n=1 Tax=Seminavis robusta TaxID=568900 RepID=A0A9N8HWD5_9STRA|nr:Peroxisomal N(1)-acetyl-spermine/spermidine oxidase [Seminavis robusta]|eukprot:Sro2150_g316660.1 Peroxisomal N(1)-acetyl-spermine/spermidine oxidase (437) ;mRNA; f:471-1845
MAANMNVSAAVNATLVNVDVLIIGAGAAGLTAAYDLKRSSDNSFRILEASSVIGGRLKKMPTGFADFPIDIGGEWIHDEPTVLENITGVEVEVETIPYVDSYVEWEDGEWYSYGYYTEDYKFVNYTWFDLFNDYMAPDVLDHVDFDCQVEFIDWSTIPVEVSCSDGLRYFTANHVIVTVPMSVLQSDDIYFEPALPVETQVAIDKYDFMSGMKVFMKYGERFYREAFEFASDYPYDEDWINGSSRYFYSATFGQDTDLNILGSFSVGDTYEPFVNLTNEQIFASINTQLDSVYEGQASEYFVEGYVQDWNDQPYIRGSYTHLDETPDEWDAIEELRLPLEDRIFFAGEAIPPYTYQFGNVHGAAYSGRAAAEKIMDLLGQADADLDASISRTKSGEALEHSEKTHGSPSLSSSSRRTFVSHPVVSFCLTMFASYLV